jgi:cell division protein FtsL
MTIFLAELLFFTWCRVQSIGTGYEISRETQRHQDLINFQNKLKVELARLKSPERIAKIAKNQLGLITPTQEQMIVIP